jgi:two-component system NtrC family sensor kinase
MVLGTFLVTPGLVNVFRQKRLALRLILSLTFLIIVAEGISGYYTIKTQEEQLLRGMIVGADQLSNGITSATWHAMLADHRDDAYNVMQTIALKQGIRLIRIFNKEGRVMFSTASGEQSQVDKKAEACYLCHASDKPLVKVDVPNRARVFRGQDGNRRLAMITPIYNEPSCAEADCHAHPTETKVLGVLDVAFDLDPVDTEMAAMQRRVFIVAGIHIFLIGIFIIFFIRHFVDVPIQKLIDGTRAVSAMHLDTPIVVDTGGELGELAQSFDAMRERLKLALKELNEFTESLETKVAERTEELNAVNQRLQRSDRLASLGQLAASVAHEINNPIFGVLNLSSLLQRIINEDGIPPNRIEEVRKHLDRIVDETSRVGRIVADLLAFSKRSKPQQTKTDMNAVVNSALAIIGHKLKLMNVEIDVCLASDLPVILCDASQMQQVLVNLIMNGAEATQGRTGACVKVTMRVDKRAGTLALQVSDNGDGIPQEYLSKIFDPFFTTKEEGKGVGLGLAVVYGIIQSHHGDIEAKSDPKTGTVFTVTLPIADVNVEIVSKVSSQQG